VGENVGEVLDGILVGLRVGQFVGIGLQGAVDLLVAAVGMHPTLFVAFLVLGIECEKASSSSRMKA
jgi:hypothetical protein